MQNGRLRHSDFFHTGIIVDDLSSAKEELGELLDVTWGLEGDDEVPMLLADGPRMVRMAIAYSSEGPHYIELVESVERTLWTVPHTGHAHHVGYWSDDVRATSAFLSGQGLPRVVNIGTFEEDAFPMGVFHQARNGLYIEVLNRALMPMMFGMQPVGDYDTVMRALLGADPDGASKGS